MQVQTLRCCVPFASNWFKMLQLAASLGSHNDILLSVGSVSFSAVDADFDGKRVFDRLIASPTPGAWAEVNDDFELILTSFFVCVFLAPQCILMLTL